MKKRVLIPPSPLEILALKGRRGAPFGNRNALKHGKYTRARRALNADISAYVRRCNALLEEFGFHEKPKRPPQASEGTILTKPTLSSPAEQARQRAATGRGPR